MRDHTARTLSTVHRILYRATRGRIGRRLVNNDILLLSTTGRATSNDHTVPLLYLRDGEDLVVVASWGGRDTNPEWYLNLLANPAAFVQINGDRFPVTAATADPNRRERLWSEVLVAYDGYREYQTRTDREIPVVILSHERN